MRFGPMALALLLSIGPPVSALAQTDMPVPTHNPRPTTDPFFLDCNAVTGSRKLLGIVVFLRLHKVRIWYGDGGGYEWSGIDFNLPFFATTIDDGSSLVLSRDYQTIVYNGSQGEQSRQDCRVSTVPQGMRSWLNPVMPRFGSGG